MIMKLNVLTDTGIFCYGSTNVHVHTYICVYNEDHDCTYMATQGFTMHNLDWLNTLHKKLWRLPTEACIFPNPQAKFKNNYLR